MPSITGNVRIASDMDYLSANEFSGVFFTDQKGSKSSNWYSGGFANNRLNFDASLSNAIYGASNTVQPPALILLPQIKY